MVVDLALLGWFKYYGFFVDSVGDALDRIGLGVSPPLLEIALPVGISFFTFHAISYVIDIGRGQLRPLRLDELALYMSFFPHLVAGPIVRASEFAPQLHVRSDPRRIPSGEAFRLIAFGLFKKVVVSSYVASEIVDPVFAAPSAHGPLDLLVGVYAYAIQIYADFSGYTDIAIGCALLLGIRFPQNFDAPYRALSIQDFWRRWHMTLSRWLRDYLYIPLGGSRHGEHQTYRNLFLTMVIGGLWHGAAMTFLVWGALHGGYLVGERWVKERWAATHPAPVLPAALTVVLQWVLTFNLVCLAWIFFRADPRRRLRRARRDRRRHPAQRARQRPPPRHHRADAGQPVRPAASGGARPGALHCPRPWPPGRRPGRRSHRDRRPRPRWRGPVHLLQVLMHPRRSPSASSSELVRPASGGPIVGSAGGGAATSRVGGSGGASAPHAPRRTPAPRRRPTSRGIPGEQSAGRILLTMVLALALAALVNADSLVRRAESKPLGPARDRSLLLWHPVQDIAHITQISRLRDLGDWMVGNEDRGGGGVPFSGPTTTVPAGLERPTLRAPTADEPLRVYIGGDSIVRDAGDAFLNIASDSPLFETTLHYENATGLARPDFYDWPAAFREDMEAHRPEVAFILFGGNDSQGILGPNGEVFEDSSDPGWREEYARRVGGVMDILRADDRIVYWIAPPTDARRGIRRPRRDHERDLPRSGGEPSVDDLPRPAPDVRRRTGRLRGAPGGSERRAGGPSPGRRGAPQPGGRRPARPGDAGPDRRGDPGGPGGADRRRLRRVGLRHPRRRSRTASS